MGMIAAVLFARIDSNYKQLAGLDVYDIERDARNYSDTLPVIAHPPCRAWGRLRMFAKPRPDEKELAFFAIEQVQKNGGVLEHPAHSSLWSAAQLPMPGQRGQKNDFTLPITQHWFGHRAEKATWLYICGCSPEDLPAIPLVLGESSHVVAQKHPGKQGRIRKGMPGWRPELGKAEREHTPPELCRWLVKTAVICGGVHV